MDLTALQHSPFLQSLGWAIANSLWQAAALWIAYLLITGVYKSASAKFKNNLSTILLGSAFVWFCITLFIKYFALENTGTYVIRLYETKNIAATYNWDALLNKMTAALPYLSAAYLLLLVFLSLRLINVYRFTRFIKYNGLQKPGAEWKLFTEKVALHMGITRKIKLWVSHHIDVPATIGFIKPVILIPLASVNRLSADQLEAIILHELSHIKRNDYLINLFISIIETILFFNPFVVILAKIIKRERENCCDDFVIQYQYDRHAYASALLSLEQFRNVNLRLAIGATSGKKQLLLRVKRIMEINSSVNFNYGQKLAALLLITGIICSVAWLSPQHNENKQLLASKAANTNDYKKPNRNEKTETIYLNTPGIAPVISPDKIKTTGVKQQAKKSLNRSEKQLKELSQLNLMAIAEQDYRRANFLLQESKKQVIRKKIRVNRFQFPAGAMFTTSFDKLTGAPFANFNNEEFNRQHAYTALDLQKLQAEIEKAQFSFSFDNDKMQEAVKLAFDSKQILRLMELQKVKEVKDIKPEKVTREGQSQGSGGTSARRSPEHMLYSTTPGAHSSTLMYVDSAEWKAFRSKQLQGRAVTKAVIPVDMKLTTEAVAYTYGYSNDNAVTDRKNTDKVPERTVVVEGKLTPGTTVVPGATYRRVITENVPTRIVSRTKPTSKENVKIECKNGVLYINGKEINLTDTDEMLAQISLKGKKVTAKVKDIYLEIND